MASSPSRRSRDSFRYLETVLTSLLVLPACSGLRANEEAKGASIVPWRTARIGDAPALQFLLRRTGVVLSGADGFAPNSNEPRLGGVPTRGGTNLRTVSGAACAAIDIRGYWLTAAHCVVDQPLLIVTNDGSELRWWPARIVWSGQEPGGKDGVDLALLQASGAPFGVLDLAELPPDEGFVLCAGSGLGSGRFAAGRITGVSGSTVDASFTEIHHDAPLSVGDSGGPVILADGALVGVDVLTTSLEAGQDSRISTAIHAEPGLLRSLIESDIAQNGK